VELLGAPNRITELVDSGAAAVLRAPASILRGSRLASATLGAMLKALERWIGRDLLANLSDFATGFEPLLAGFRTRARDIQNELRARHAATVLITTPQPAAIQITRELSTDLRANRLRVAGVIANQVHKVPRVGEKHHLLCSPALREKLWDNHRDYARRARHDRAALARVGVEIAPVLATVPRLDEPIASLAQLGGVAELLLPQIR
jgi:anion-transporting  ArsA/GET3 family ATPase